MKSVEKVCFTLHVLFYVHLKLHFHKFQKCIAIGQEKKKPLLMRLKNIGVWSLKNYIETPKDLKIILPSNTANNGNSIE